MLDISHLEVPENAIILIRDKDNEFGDEQAWFDLAGQLHEKFHGSLVVWFTGDMDWETHSE